MSRYRGPAVLTVEDGTAYTGTATLRTTESGGRIGWQGSFVPADGSPVKTGAGRIVFDGREGDVLVSNWTFQSGGHGTAVILGQDEPPF